MKKQAKRNQITRQRNAQKRHARAADPAKRSRPARRGPSPSHARPADKLALVESFDNYAGLRNGLRRIAQDRDEWAGIPMPLDGQRLIIEPTYPQAQELAAIGQPQPAKPEPSDAKLRNTFWSFRWRSEIVIGEENGKIVWGKQPGANHLGYDLQTLGCSDAWGVEQEGKAVRLLGTLLKHRQFKQYMLTGMFLETSKSSGVTYLFRRLKPTIALVMKARARALRFDSAPEHVRILCALCLHPIGYYAGSWAGAMCPTDDLISHLMMMRGDEKLFWRRCNQIAPYLPNAGI